MIFKTFVFLTLLTIVLGSIIPAPHPQTRLPTTSLHKRAEAQPGSISNVEITIDNITVAIASVSCSGAVSTDTASITVTITTDQAFSLVGVSYYIGAAGTTPSIPPSQYGQVPNNAQNGYSGTECGLKSITYTFNVTLDELAFLQTTCYVIDIVVELRQFCGSYTSVDALSYSPSGCDTEYQLLYPAEDSYVSVQLAQGSSFLEGYCLSPSDYIDANTAYRGQLLSSYDPVVLNSAPGQYVANPQNLDIVNYIFNNQGRYLVSYKDENGNVCTWVDIQNAIWTILDPASITANPSLLLSGGSAQCLANITADAYAHGENYVPPCPGGRYIVLLVPTELCGTECIRLNQTQVTGFIQGGPCLNQCNISYCYFPGLHASGNFCLSGNCLPSPSVSTVPSISSRPVLPEPSPSASNSMCPMPMPSPTPSNSMCNMMASPTPSNSMCSTPMGPTTADNGNGGMGGMGK